MNENAFSNVCVSNVMKPKVAIKTKFDYGTVSEKRTNPWVRDSCYCDCYAEQFQSTRSIWKTNESLNSILETEA